MSSAESGLNPFLKVRISSHLAAVIIALKLVTAFDSFNRDVFSATVVVKFNKKEDRKGRGRREENAAIVESHFVWVHLSPRFKIVASVVTGRSSCCCCCCCCCWRRRRRWCLFPGNTTNPAARLVQCRSQRSIGGMRKVKKRRETRSMDSGWRSKLKAKERKREEGKRNVNKEEEEKNAAIGDLVVDVFASRFHYCGDDRPSRISMPNAIERRQLSLFQVSSPVANGTERDRAERQGQAGKKGLLSPLNIRVHASVGR